MIGLLMVPLLLAQESVEAPAEEAAEVATTPDRTAPPAVIPPVVMTLPAMSALWFAPESAP